MRILLKQCECNQILLNHCDSIGPTKKTNVNLPLNNGKNELVTKIYLAKNTNKNANSKMLFNKENKK